MSDFHCGQLGVLGPGLLGASVLMAARAAGLCDRTLAWSRREESRRQCEACDWCDACPDEPEALAEQADFLVLCPPVDSLPDWLSRLASHRRKEALWTDVGSTKQMICEAGATLPWFVGAHPMAGSEKTGNAHARADLFEGRTCLLTPLPETASKDSDRVQAFWEALGMRVQRCNPKVHDQLVAHISHLPHLLAAALCSFLAKNDPGDWGQAAGGGLLDTSRVAGGDPALWRAIVESNQQAIEVALEGCIQELTTMQEQLRTDQLDALQQTLALGQQYRQGIEPEKSVS